MFGLNEGLLLGLGLLALAIHMASVALARGLRTYSKSLLEEHCERRGRPEQADEVDHLDERTERAAEAMEIVSGLFLAALLGAATPTLETWPTRRVLMIVALAVGALGHLLAGAMGRARAEDLIVALWPLAAPLRRLATPLTFLSRLLELSLERLSRRPDTGPRPTSVEVEIRHDDDDPEEDLEAELPEVTHEILEAAVELARRDVAELMVPRSAIVDLPASVSAEAASRTFYDSGRSRIPLFGESRDDIVGILYLKDLTAALLDAATSGTPPPSPRKLARAAYCIPETKAAIELLEEFRTRRTHLAMALDEYGGVAGLITIEDLLEQLVGPIDDEHDVPPSPDSLVDLGDGRFEVDAATPLEVLNERLGLRLPTNSDFQTIGGLAFNALGHLPEPGDSFRHDDLGVTIVEVYGRSIRRILLDTRPEEAPVGGGPSD